MKRQRRTHTERLQADTVVTVPAETFDDIRVPEEDRWSAQFQCRGDEKLWGKVVSHTSDNPVVRFDFDGKSTSVPLAKITVVPMTETYQESPFEFENESGRQLIKNAKRKKPKGPENDVIVIKPLRAENAPSVATTDPGQLATEKKEALQTDSASTVIVRNPLILRTEAASSSASSAASSAASSVNLAVDQTVEMKDRTKVKKLPIYKRPVNCLDAAEEESNYDTNIELPEPPISLSSKFKTSDKNYRTINYSTKKNTKVRRSGRDILVGNPGVADCAKDFKTPTEAFDFYFPLTLQRKICSFTNKRIASTLRKESRSRSVEETQDDDDDDDDDEGPDVEDEDASGIGVWMDAEDPDGSLDDGLEEDLENLDREYTKLEIEDDFVISEGDKMLEKEAPKFKQFLSLDEFRAFLGLWYLRGLYSQAGTKLANLYQHDHLPVFSAVMPRKRFKWIMRHLSFDGCINSTERASRWQHDRLAAVRYVFEEVNTNWSKAIIPSQYITIDETLYNLYTQVAFKVYNKLKPHKYGVLFKSTNSVEYPYTFTAHCYAGSPEGKPNQYYVKGTDNYTKYCVSKLAEKVPLTGRNLTMDRLYTSVPIMEWLWEKQHMTGLGTFQSNRKGFPSALKTPGANKSSEVYYQEDGPLSLVRYSTVTKSSGAVSVVLLTTRKPMLGVTRDEQRKPAMFKLYDFTKTGTDQMDSRFSTGKYCSKPKTRRWTIAFFSYLLDTTRVNTQTLCALNNGEDARKVDSFDFGKKFAMDLIGPYLEKRDISRLSSSILVKLFTLTQDRKYLMALLRLHEPPSPAQELAFCGQSSSQLKRCNVCIRSLESSLIDGKIRNKAIGNLTRVGSICEQCSQVRCKKHLIKLCETCYDKISR